MKLCFAEEASILSLDDYYLPYEKQQKDSNGVTNFDLLTALDIEKFKADLTLLKRGKTIELEEYTFNNAEKQRQSIQIIPNRFILVEGIFLLEALKESALLDLSIFVDTEVMLMLERRLGRDVQERNIEEELVLYQWENHFMPAYEKFILPHKEHSDLIVSGENDFKDSLIYGQIKRALESKAL